MAGLHLALTVITAGLDPGDKASLQCIATTTATLPVPLTPILNTAAPSVAVSQSRPPVAVRSNDIVWVSGLCAKQANASDAFALLEQMVTMEDVLHCKFFLSNLTDMQTFFGGFYDAFNVGAPPPPSRAEFVALSATNESCKVVVHCCAAESKPQERQLS